VKRSVSAVGDRPPNGEPFSRKNKALRDELDNLQRMDEAERERIRADAQTLIDAAEVKRIQTETELIRAVGNHLKFRTLVGRVGNILQLSWFRGFPRRLWFLLTGRV